MTQLFMPKEDTWATLRIFLQKIGNGQGWAGGQDNLTMIKPTDRNNAINFSPIKPAQVKDKVRDGYCYNDEVAPNGRLIFQQKGIEYHPRTKPAEQKRPLYYIEPDPFESESEAKGVLVVGFAAAILDMDHSQINQGKLTKYINIKCEQKILRSE